MADVCLLLLEDGSGFLTLEDGSGRLLLESCLQPSGVQMVGGWAEEWRIRENEADVVAATVLAVVSRRRRLRVG